MVNRCVVCYECVQFRQKAIMPHAGVSGVGTVLPNKQIQCINGPKLLFVCQMDLEIMPVSIKR